MNEKIPRLKKARLTALFTLPMEQDLKDELAALKRENGVDISEWMRMVLRREVEKLKTSL